MPETNADVNVLTILITTGILLFLGVLVIYFLFQYQRRRYKHQQELKDLKEAFNQNLLQSKLEIQEQTLEHIAKELHANFSHLVSVININLGTINPTKPAEMQERIAEAKSLAKQLMLELKALSVTLNTDHIMHTGFLTALENELNRLERTKLYKTILTKTGEEYRLRPENEIIFFRMCQEILNNIVKHAGAKTITVIVDYAPDLFTLQITDDGKGFDMAAAEKLSAEKGSTGLRNIQNRSRLIDAAVTTTSQPGSGTTTKVIIPIHS